MEKKTIFEMSIRELRQHLKKQTDIQFEEWLQKLNINAKNINPATIHSYLHTVFQEIPFDRTAINKVIEVCVDYLETSPNLHFKHLVLLGHTFFGQRHLTFILKTILQPLADHNHYTIHTFTERELHENINRHGGVFNIHNDARILIFQLSSISLNTRNIVNTIRQSIDSNFNGLLVTAWTDVSWDSLKDLVTSIQHPYEIVKFAHPSKVEFFELLQYVLKYIGYAKPISDDLFEYVFNQSNGNIDIAISIIIEAFRNMCDSRAKNLEFNDLIAGSISVLQQKEETERKKNSIGDFADES